MRVTVPVTKGVPMFRRYRRSALAAAALAVGTAAAGVLGFAAPAAAHVTVNPKTATPGGYARVDFRVPNESATASTNKLEIVLPEDAPIASVSTKPVPGWTITVEKRTLDTPLEVHGSQVTEAVSKITWTAQADAVISAGQFQEFPVSMGPLPQVDRLVFKALQTYTDGNVVRWIEEPVAGGEEPANPAPVLTLAAATEPVANPAASQPATAAGSEAEGDSSGGNVLGIAGLIAGLAGLALGGLAFARSRQAGPAGS